MAVSLRVHHNGDDVLLTWRVESAIEGCRGFAIMRRVDGARAAPLPSYAGFADETWKRGDKRPSTVWPIQKFWWTDYTARNGQTVSYRIVPMVGPDREHLTKDEADASPWSPPAKLDHRASPHVSTFFNRGIVASQWVQRLLDEDVSVAERRKRLDQVIVDLGRPTARNLLSGELRLGLRALLSKARQQDLRVGAALFELVDEQLIRDLEALGPRLEIVLANGAPDAKKKRSTSDNDLPADPGAAPTPDDENDENDENHDARQRLQKAGATVHDRMCAPRLLGHNKFVVVRDAQDRPRWTWTGSTNWTASGLCTQANNAVLIDDHAVAERFWDQMQALDAADDLSPRELADANSTATDVPVDGGSVRTWFTRTMRQVDLDDAKRLVAEATDGALFLMFQTGATGSLLEAILKRTEDRGFFVHGVISSPPQTGRKPAGTPSTPKTPEQARKSRIAFVHKNERIRYAPDLLLPFAHEAPSEQWLGEFVKKNGAHAIVHSKAVVLDPFGARPVVITGSHNLGTTASKTNDENMVFVVDNPGVAAAYATNIIAIYDNYRWRYRVAQGTRWKGSADDDRWQVRYLDGSVPELAFFNS